MTASFGAKNAMKKELMYTRSLFNRPCGTLQYLTFPALNAGLLSMVTTVTLTAILYNTMLAPHRFPQSRSKFINSRPDPSDYGQGMKTTELPLPKTRPSKLDHTRRRPDSPAPEAGLSPPSMAVLVPGI